MRVGNGACGRTLFIATVALALSVGAAQAAEPIVLNLANCFRWPTIRDEREARTRAGVLEGVSGDVTMHCDLAVDIPRNCRITSEQPTGNHFADAALLLDKRFDCRTEGAGDRVLQIDLSYHFNRVAPDPAWEDGLPTWDQLKPIFPPAMIKAGVSGAAAVECGVSPEGLFRRCKVIAEAPPGLGLGNAVLLVAPGFRTDAPVKNGRLIPDYRDRFGIYFPNIGRGYYEKEDLEPVRP